VPEKILIIDDDPDTIEFLTLILQRLGYQVLEARDGMDASHRRIARSPI